MTTELDDGVTVPDYRARIEAATATTVLPDGRSLAYSEFGAPDGPAVFVFHGGIGSRGFGLLFEPAATALGARIIAPDRPGYGRSDPDPDRTMLSWSADVAATASTLGLDRLRVLGVSGGGPFAASCVAGHPELVDAAALVSSVGPPAGPRPLALRVFFRIARWAPPVAGLAVRRQLRRARADPEAAMAARVTGKSAADASIHTGDPGRRLTASTAEAGRQGHRHAVREMALVGRPWGFDLSTLSAPVRIWHGREDRTVPLTTAQYVADEIPDARLTVADGLGHLSLPVERAEEILSWLLDG